MDIQLSHHTYQVSTGNIPDLSMLILRAFSSHIIPKACNSPVASHPNNNLFMNKVIAWAPHIPRESSDVACFCLACYITPHVWHTQELCVSC